MKKYEVEIREILSMTVEVEAPNREAAIDITHQNYLKGEYFLDSECSEGPCFYVKRPPKYDRDVR